MLHAVVPGRIIISPSVVGLSDAASDDMQEGNLEFIGAVVNLALKSIGRPVVPPLPELRSLGFVEANVFNCSL
jgi:hypothetical protein